MGYKILVVDDERDVVETLESRLLKEGYAVATAYDGEEALAKVKADDPDIILLDLALPKLNGFEVLKRVRELYTDKWRPVIIISAQNELNSIKKGYSLEADHYLTKPCTIENILRAIETMISLIPVRKIDELSL
ncbi:MAG: response regulator [Candidatus Omnitrophica bacterium]|nr:response regulator [Candidatus Omnitrophota bacterium]